MYSKYIWPQTKCPSPIFVIALIILSYDSHAIPAICSLKKLYNNPCVCAFIDYVSLFPEQTDYVVNICKNFTTLKGTILEAVDLLTLNTTASKNELTRYI